MDAYDIEKAFKDLAEQKFPEYIQVADQRFGLSGGMLAWGKGVYRLSYVKHDFDDKDCRDRVLLDIMNEDSEICLKEFKEGLDALDYKEIDKPLSKEEQFIIELTSLLNRYSKENSSDTPDHILAAYIEMCLRSFNVSVRNREDWHGRKKVRESLSKEEL